MQLKGGQYEAVMPRAWSSSGSFSSSEYHAKHLTARHQKESAILATKEAS